MTRTRVLAIALATLTPALATALAAGQPAPAPAPAAQPAPQQKALAVIAAQQLARGALIDHRINAEPGPADDRYLARLLRDAATLDPANQPIVRYALEAAANCGDQTAVVELSRALVALNPDDTAAQLNLIRARVEQSQSVEERLTVLEAFLGPRGDSIDPSVRSRLALEACLLCRERGDAAGFVKYLTAATTLDSSNKPAAALALEYYASRVKDAEGRFELLANTLIAAPLDPTVQIALAKELAAAGATDQAIRFYDNAFALYRRHGRPLDIEENQDRAQQQADRLVQLWKSQGPQTIIKQLNDAVDEPRRELQVALDVATATGKNLDELKRPQDHRIPICLERVRIVAAMAAGDRSTLLRALDDFTASLNALAQDDPDRPRLRTELGYLNAMAAVGDTAAETAAVKTFSPDNAQAIARMEAWTKLRSGSPAEARAAFEAMKSDPLATLALAVIDLEAKPAPDSVQSRALNDRLLALAQDNGASPISAWATTVYQSRNSEQAPASSALAQKFTAMGAGIPAWIDDIAKEPNRFIVVKAEPSKGSSGLSPLEPTLLNIRVSNNTPVPLAIGPGQTVEDRLLVTTYVDIGGLRNADLVRTETANIGGRLRLMPREEVTFPVWADSGIGGWGVQNALSKSARMRFTVVQGYIVDNDGPKPGPFGTTIEAGPIMRGSVPLGDVNRLASDLATLQDEDFANAVLHARLQLINRDKPITVEQAKVLVNALCERYRKATAVERLVILTTSPAPKMAGAIIDLERVVAQIDETNPVVARAALLTRVYDAGSPIIAKYRTFPDPGVQEAVKYLEARIAADKGVFAGVAPTTTAPAAPAKK